jgi:hypothetical protein
MLTAVIPTLHFTCNVNHMSITCQLDLACACVAARATSCSRLFGATYIPASLSRSYTPI